MGEVDQFSIEELDRRKIVNGSMQNSKILNIFRELRTQLIKTNKKKNFVCMVTSISQGGGASYVASNLASVFALDKTKTSMLIDANLYAPSLDSLIIGDVITGITDYLSDTSLNIKDVVYATGIPRLRVVPIGNNSEAAAEYFSSEKMLHFIDEIRTRYADRYVFIDAPPVTESSEARILAEIADMVILVVPHGRATHDQVEAAISILGKDKISGLVYNN
jgi:protein-tyrosine kinase